MSTRLTAENAPLPAAVTVGFVDRMTDHLRKHFPAYCDGLGESLTRQAILEGIGRASEYSIVGDRNVCRFIDLLFAFGPTFDLEPDFAWAREILEDSSVDSAAKMKRLYNTALAVSRLHHNR